MSSSGVSVHGDSAARETVEELLVQSGRPMPDSLVCHAWREASLDRIAEVAEVHGETVVVLDERPSPYVARVLLRAVQGVVLTEDLDSTLLPTIDAVTVGLRSYPERIARDLREPILSAREKQMLAMVALDFSNAEIARKLHVSESNVKFHLSSAFGKIGVRSRSAAAAMILDPNTGLGLGILRITGPSEDRL